EEITHARCIDCDRIIDSRGATHDRSLCVLKKYFSCPKCSESFNFERNLDVHLVVEHSVQADYIAGSECTFCDGRRKKTFRRYHAFLAHVKQHMKPDHFFCSSCPEEFLYPVSLYSSIVLNFCGSFAHLIGTSFLFSLAMLLAPTPFN
ncbi:zinc finger, C2H2 type, partial [Necator americanus]